MQREVSPAIPCPHCGLHVALSDFVPCVDAEHGRVAICSGCGNVVAVAKRRPPAWSQHPQRANAEERARATVLAATAFSAHAARAFTRETMAQWELEPTNDNVVLVVNELITEAVAHPHGPIVLALGLRAGVIRAVVADEPVSLPIQRESGPIDATDYGLAVVAALASDWGSSSAPTGDGTMSWADIDLTDERPGEIDLLD